MPVSVIDRSGDGATTTTTALARARPDAADIAIDVRGLRMSYDGVEAVRGIDMRVSRGEIFALLGPNGAGKTTTVEILEGHRKRTTGDVSCSVRTPTAPIAGGGRGLA